MSSRKASGWSKAACTRLAEALAGLGERRRRQLPLRRRRCARSRSSGGRADGVRLADGERHRGRRGRRQRRRRGAGQRACSGRRRLAPCRRRRAAPAVAVGGDLGAGGRGRGLPAVTPQRLLLRRLPGRVRRHLRAMAACRRAPTVYVCAQDRGDDGHRRRRAPSGCCAWSTRRPTATPTPSTQRRSSDARRGPSACWRAAACG